MKGIVRLNGGLGNQMFQYAFARQLMHKYRDAEIKFDYKALEKYPVHSGLEINKIFRIDLPQAKYREILNSTWPFNSRYWLHLHKLIPRTKTVVNEKNFNHSLITTNKQLYYDGFWQNEVYFNEVKDIVAQEFSCHHFLGEKNQKLLCQIDNKNTVAIHVRRGDYIGNPLYSGICNIEYYRKAINLIEELEKPDYFIIFSNDVNWCRQNIISSDNSTLYVDWNKGNDSYKDMILMSKCSHNIIANSSFSWWGAWLNKNPLKRVICPNKWDNSIDSVHPAPPEWIKI